VTSPIWSGLTFSVTVAAPLELLDEEDVLRVGAGLDPDLGEHPEDLGQRLAVGGDLAASERARISGLLLGLGGQHHVGRSAAALEACADLLQRCSAGPGRRGPLLGALLFGLGRGFELGATRAELVLAAGLMALSACSLAT
jgi:hypothetical protein